MLFSYPLEEGSLAAGELGFLFNHGEDLIVIHGFGFLLFDDNFLFVFTHHVEVVSTLVKVSGTYGGVSILEVVLRLDFFNNFFVTSNLELGGLYSVEDFFRKSFGLLLFDALLFWFFRFFLFLLISSIVDHGLLNLVFRTLFSFLEHSVCKESEDGYKKKDDEDHEHRAVVALCRGFSELIGTEILVFAFKYNVNPF